MGRDILLNLEEENRENHIMSRFGLSANESFMGSSRSASLRIFLKLLLMTPLLNLSYILRRSPKILAFFTAFSFIVFDPESATAVSVYLPMKLPIEEQSKIERLFVLADMPVIKRPIAVQQVRSALNKLGSQHASLVADIESYLIRYESRHGFSNVSVSTSFASSNTVHKISNQYGITTADDYVLSIQSHVKATSWLNASIGGQFAGAGGSIDNNDYSNSYLSLGVDSVQLDIGYRPHWFGPFQGSDMLISTNAQSIPSVTLSNIQPIQLWKTQFNYEIFLARMSYSTKIRANDNSTTRLPGHPKLFGLHISFVPVEGFALGFNRLMQFGGGHRDSSISSLAEAIFFPSEADNIDDEGRDFGNQLTSITTRFTFNERHPFSVYMEYAGEDTSATSEVHLGNTSLMFGLHLPVICKTFDFTYETAQWQNGWYVNTNYGDGLRQRERIIGHWGADQRIEGNAVGARVHMAKLNWQIDSNRMVELKVHSIKNNPRSSDAYKTGNGIELTFSQAWKELHVGLTALAGSDVFDDNFNQVALFLRW